jgi:Yip1 domain
VPRDFGPAIGQRSLALRAIGDCHAVKRTGALGNGIMDIVDRVKAILLTPKSEWLVIERESGDPTYLFTNYVAILAAIPAVCGFVGTSIIGIGTVRVGIVFGIAFAIVNYLLAFVMVYVMGLIINALAPTFNGQKNQPNALKLAVYSMTPAWLAGIFSLIPGFRVLGILGILLGLYRIYLLWVGLPPLMKSPEENSLGYAAAIVGCAIVISLVISAIDLFATQEMMKLGFR